MAARTMHVKEKAPASDESDEAVHTQRRPSPERYLLQVDHQTKSSFSKKEDAEASGAAVKKRFPHVHVRIYDSVTSESFIVVVVS